MVFGMKKYSYQRELVKTYLLNNFSHPTAEEIYTGLKKNNPNLSLATVYRNLKLLVSEGIAGVVAVIGGKEHYDAVLHKHDHFICNKGGKIFDLNCESLLKKDDYFTLGNEFEISDHKLNLYGICPACRAE